MKHIYLLKLVMKTSLFISLILLLFLVIQNQKSFGENNEQGSDNLYNSEVLETKVVRLNLEIKQTKEKVSTTQRPISSGEKGRLFNKHEEQNIFWSSLVQRFWNLTNSPDDEIQSSDFTEKFITNVEYRLWGSNSKQFKKDYFSESSGFLDMDRILPQLVFVMEGHKYNALRHAKMKKILLYDSFNWWNYKGEFFKECPGWTSKCEFVETQEEPVDAIITTRDSFHTDEVKIQNHVTRFFFILESPLASSATLKRVNDLLSSYWRESDLVTPYAKWVYYDSDVRRKHQNVYYANEKKKMAAIFVSNCHTRNGRMDYVKELQNYIEIDIYGRCGKKRCPRDNEQACFDMLKSDYKFYLSFENSNCRDYITEKFFINALSNNVVPVVMGAHPDDYKATAPENSYLHIENFTSARELAERLKKLASNDEEYAKYFEWKGTGEFVPAKYFCRVCAMLHYSDLVQPPNRRTPFEWNKSNLDLCMKKEQRYWWN